MVRTMNEHKENRRKKVPVTDEPAEETLLIRQRLRNLCELAIEIGQKQGLLGNHKNNDVINSEGGQDVPENTDTQVCRDTQTTPVVGRDRSEERRNGLQPGVLRPE